MKMSTLSRTIKGLCQREDLDDEFLESYRKVLFGQYNSLANPVPNEAAKKEAEAVIAMPTGELGWDDLYRLELAIIKLEPAELLRRRAWILRNEYKEMVSSGEYKDYEASKPPAAGPEANIDDLRADLVRLQEELNWRYIVVWMLETYRALILKSLVCWTIGIVLLGISATYWASAVALIGSWTNLNLPFLMAIVMPGIVGGLISTVRRLHAVQFGRNADLDLTQLEQGNTSIYLSPFLGGVFALVLFFLFAAGLVTGDLFPKVSLDNLLISGLEELNYKEAAKLMAWSFLAGFAEQFVPDRLEQLAQKGGQPTTSATAKKSVA
jgi:hypothetical protein